MKFIRPEFRTIVIAVCLSLLPLAAFGQQGNTSGAASKKYVLFGQEMGAAFTLPECPKVQKKINGKKVMVYADEYEINSMCYVGQLLENTVVGILIPSNKRSEYIRMRSSDVPTPVRAHILDGKLQGIDFETFAGSTDTAYQDLINDLFDKFGKPTATSTKSWENNLGPDFTRKVYDWDLGWFAVNFQESRIIVSDSSNTISATYGTVTAYTPKVAAFMIHFENEKKKAADEERRKKKIGI